MSFWYRNLVLFKIKSQLIFTNSIDIVCICTALLKKRVHTVLLFISSFEIPSLNTDMFNQWSSWVGFFSYCTSVADLQEKEFHKPIIIVRTRYSCSEYHWKYKFLLHVAKILLKLTYSFKTLHINILLCLR